MNKAFRVARKALFYLILKISLVVILVLFILSACTKELEYELNNTKSLVINSVFHPDDKFNFTISYTAFPLDQYDTINEELHLLFYEKNKLLVDTFITSGILSTNIYPKPNTKYRVELISNNRLPVSACDSIPNEVAINEATYKFPAGTDEYGDYYAEAMIHFTDPADEQNYYELLIYSFNGLEENYWNGSGDYVVTDPVLLNEGDVDYKPSSLFFSDELFNGEEYIIKCKGDIAYSSNSTGIHPIGQLFVILRSVSKSYYLYRKYYTRHAHNQQFQGDFLDLVFQGEPQSMYTNIDNGFGVFVAYQETTREVTHIE